MTENMVKVPQKQLASLKTIWKLECSSRTLSVRHVLQKAAVKIALLWDLAVLVVDRLTSRRPIGIPFP